VLEGGLEVPFEEVAELSAEPETAEEFSEEEFSGSHTYPNAEQRPLSKNGVPPSAMQSNAVMSSSHHGEVVVQQETKSSLLELELASECSEPSEDEGGKQFPLCVLSHCWQAVMESY